MKRNTDNDPLIYNQINIDRVQAELKRLGSDKFVIADWNGYLAIAVKPITEDSEHTLISEQSLAKTRELSEYYLFGEPTLDKAQTFWDAVGEVDHIGIEIDLFEIVEKFGKSGYWSLIDGEFAGYYLSESASRILTNIPSKFITSCQEVGMDVGRIRQSK
jgi:hypothetical protein